MMAKRIVVVLMLLLVLPGVAFANSAMALALSIFAWPLWLVYVAAMVFFEAFWIGRALKMPFPVAMGKSLKANALTLVLGALFSGFFGYLLYGTFGSFYNPNPLGESILLLTVGALVSAAMEAPQWGDPIPWRATFAAHVLGVPVALVILLLPPHPYPGLEAQAAWRRGRVVDGSSPLLSALQEELSEKERFPQVATFPELVAHLRPRLRSGKDEPDLWAVAYRPDFQRFDTGEQRRNPVEWNAALAGKRPEQLSAAVWVIRWRYRRGGEQGEGIVYTQRAVFDRTHDPQKLGFKVPADVTDSRG